jgi:hypothetical protein
MTEHDDPDLDPDLDPQPEQRIRALLADLDTSPGATTMPPEVAARLEETLAELVAERPEVARSRPDVVPLRRRWVPRAGGAAAAVIVLGVGGVAAANLLGGSNDSMDSGSADSSAGGGSTSRESLSGSATATPKIPPASIPNAVQVRLPRVSAASFDTDVARLLQRRDTSAGGDSAHRTPEKDQRRAQLYAAACPGPRTSNGTTTTPVLYDGTRAALVIHPAQGGERLVEAWTCGGDRELDRATVPAP